MINKEFKLTFRKCKSNTNTYLLCKNNKQIQGWYIYSNCFGYLSIRYMPTNFKSFSYKNFSYLDFDDFEINLHEAKTLIVKKYNEYVEYMSSLNINIDI